MSQIPPSPGLLEYQTPPGPQHSKARFMAFLLLVIWGSLMILGGLCAVAGMAVSIVAIRSTLSSMPAGSPAAMPPGVEWILIGTAIGSFVIVVGSGITYLVCGLMVRRGGQASVIVALVLASLQMLLLLFISVASIVVAIGGGGRSDLTGPLVSTVFYGVGALYLAVVVYFLVKVLRERHWRPAA